MSSHPLPAPRYRILVVDDEPLVLEALVLALTRARELSCEVETASAGEDALAKADRFRPHLVLADFRMPGMTGIELLARVQARNPDTIRALITGYHDLEIAIEAMEKAKIHYYLQKPWNVDEIRRTVLEAVRSAGGGGSL